MKLQVKVDGQVFTVEVGDLAARPILATVDGETFEVWPEESLQNGSVSRSAVPLPAAPAAVPFQPQAALAAARGKGVLAPIPGVIVSIAVKEGDTVTVGQELCVLEAMKMKNLIRASRAGKIAVVRVASGDSVRKDQALLEFSD